MCCYRGYVPGAILAHKRERFVLCVQVGKCAQAGECWVQFSMMSSCLCPNENLWIGGQSDRERVVQHDLCVEDERRHREMRLRRCRRAAHGGSWVSAEMMWVPSVGKEEPGKGFSGVEPWSHCWWNKKQTCHMSTIGVFLNVNSFFFF